MGRRTPLFNLHTELGARIVDFGGWDMPVQYSSQIGEHHAVRRSAGVFDVSHMCVVDLRGEKVRAFLQKLLANDVGRLHEPGKALYSCMLNERRRRHRRSDRLLHDAHVVPHGRERGHARQRPRLDPQARRGLRCRSHRAHGSRNARHPGSRGTRQVREAAFTGRRANRDGAGCVRRPRNRRHVRRAHRIHRGRRVRGHAPRERRRARVERAQRDGRRLLRPRRARHAAPRSRHESLRQRHGRVEESARIRPRLDRVVRAGHARLHRAPRARSDSRAWRRR